MPSIRAEFSDQHSAVAAMDKLVGRGLGRARVETLIEEPSKPNGDPLSPSSLGRARLEVQLIDRASEQDVRALLEELGATAIDVTNAPVSTVLHDETSSTGRSSAIAASAIEASRQGNRS